MATRLQPKLPKTTEESSSNPKKNRTWTKKIFLGLTLLIIGIGIFIVFLNYTSRSSLQWVIVPNIQIHVKELCNDQRQLYPRSLNTWAFPAFSPDKQYYVDIADAKLGRTKVLKLFSADTRKEIGRYYGIYSSLFIHCWAEDSSGIYIADYEPGIGGFDIGGTPSKTGPVKKLLVP